MNVKLCMMVLLVHTIFSGLDHISRSQFYLKIVCSYPVKLKLHRIVKFVKEMMNISPFLMIAHIQER